MSTSAVYGFRKNGIEKLDLCYKDAYPMGFGIQVMEYAIHTPVEKMKEVFEQIEQFEWDEKPNEHQIAVCEEFFNDVFDDAMRKDFNYITSQSKKNLFCYNHGFPYMRQCLNILEEGNCDFAYIIDLDKETFEICSSLIVEPHGESPKCPIIYITSLEDLMVSNPYKIYNEIYKA